MTAARPQRRSGSGRLAPALVRLYADVQRAADDQRRSVARQLHDSAQQTLAAASMSLALLERQATSLNPPARAALVEAMQIVATCNQELRDISHALYPPLLEGMGLAAALRGLAARWGARRVALAIEDLPRLPAARELTLFRLIEEAVPCAFADPGLVQVRVDGAGDLQVQGLPQPGPAARSALLRLRLRAEVAGGRFTARRLRNRAGARLSLDVRFAHTSGSK